MPSNQTPNYQLSQWERADKILMDDFNADNAKIDAALTALAGQVSGKADASALAAVTQSRNCQAVTTSYTGSGTAGANAPSSISFSRRPLFIHVGGPDGSGFSAVNGQTTSVCYMNGATRYLTLNWSGNEVSWYERNGSYGSSPGHQMNEKDKRYYVFALLSL